MKKKKKENRNILETLRVLFACVEFKAGVNGSDDGEWGNVRKQTNKTKNKKEENRNILETLRLSFAHG